MQNCVKPKLSKFIFHSPFSSGISTPHHQHQHPLPPPVYSNEEKSDINNENEEDEETEGIVFDFNDIAVMLNEMKQENVTLKKMAMSHEMKQKHMEKVLEEIQKENDLFKSEMKENIKNVDAAKPSIKLIIVNQPIQSLQKLQLHQTTLERIIDLPTQPPKGTFMVKIKITAEFGNSPAGHLYGNFTMSQAGSEKTVSRYIHHYDVYANYWEYEMEIPWDSDSVIQKLHVKIDNTYLTGVYSTRGNLNYFHVSLASFLTVA